MLSPSCIISGFRLTLLNSYCLLFELNVSHRFQNVTNQIKCQHVSSNPILDDTWPFHKVLCHIKCSSETCILFLPSSNSIAIHSSVCVMVFCQHLHVVCLTWWINKSNLMNRYKLMSSIGKTVPQQLSTFQSTVDSNDPYIISWFQIPVGAQCITSTFDGKDLSAPWMIMLRERTIKYYPHFRGVPTVKSEVMIWILEH